MTAGSKDEVAGRDGGGAKIRDFGEGLAGADHLDRNMFKYNVAGRDGGGLFTDDTGDVWGSNNDYDAMIVGNTFFKNVATEAGGGLAADRVIGALRSSGAGSSSLSRTSVAMCFPSIGRAFR